MANVIDSLIVTLGLDTKGYVKGQKEAEKVNKQLAKTETREAHQRRQMESKEFRERRKRHQEYNRQAKQTIEHYRKIRREMLATLGVSASIGGMLMFARSAIVGAANMSVMSGNLGMGVRQIAGYRGAIEALGGSAAEANGLLQGATNALGEYDLRGQVTGMMSAFLELGGTLPNGRRTTASQFLRAVADRIHRAYQQSPQEGAAVARELGITSPAMIALMRRGGAGMQAMVGHQAAISGITGRTAAQAQKFRQAMVTLGATLKGVMTSGVMALMPHLVRFERKLRQLGDWVRSHGPTINRWLNEAADTVGGVAMDVNKIAKAMGGWKNVILGLAGIKALTWLLPVAKAFATMSAIAGGPITAAVTAIMALLGALMYFYHSNAKFRHIANQLGSDSETAIEAFVPGTQANKALINQIKHNASASWNALTSYFQKRPKNSGAAVTFVNGVPQIAQHLHGGAPRAPHTTNSSSSSVSLNGVTVNASAAELSRLHDALKPIFGAVPFLPDADWGVQ